MKTLREIFDWLDLTALKGKNWSMEKYPIGYSFLRNEIRESTEDDLIIGLIMTAIAEISKDFETLTPEKSREKLTYIKEGFLGKRHKDYVQTELKAAIEAAKAEKERKEQEQKAAEERKKEERMAKIMQLNAFIESGANRETAGSIIFGSEWAEVRASLPVPETVPVPAPAKPVPARTRK